MQSCPNCGSEARDGARFCTSCGYRFPGGETGSGDDASVADQEFQGWGASQDAAADDAPHEGWPASAVAADPEGGGWDPAASEAPEEPDETSPPLNEVGGFWPETPSDAWPSAPTELGAAPRQDDEGTGSPTAPTTVQEVEPDAEQHGVQSQALDLLDQLRAAIASIEATGSLDLSGVISDLEVAATPPGALPADDVSELREALFAARENPRDVDTIVDLTKRIDGLVSLVIAYDRAIAAIERSLDALKLAQHGDATNAAQSDDVDGASW